MELTIFLLQLLLFIKTPNLKTLQIFDDQTKLDTPIVLMAFLGEQPLQKMEKFCFWNYEFNSIYKVDKQKIQDIKIPLRNLSLRNLKNPFQNDENLVEFLSGFEDTLEELDVEKLKVDKVIELIFSKFHKLKTLRMRSDDVSKKFFR